MSEKNRTGLEEVCRQKGTRPLGIYVHIPFCVRRCSYCDFLSSTLGTEAQKRYFAALQEEIGGWSGRTEDFSVVSVFFGGGTPSLPSADLLTGTLDRIRRTFSVEEGAEITVECNPGTLDRDKLAAYLRAGVNRLSIGLQSADDGLLKDLGRIHDYATFRKEYLTARDLGFSNISVDLMYDLPGQNRKIFSETLKSLISLKCAPNHLSVYSLIVEEGTPFWDRYREDVERKEKGDRPVYLPSEEEEAGMLEDLKDLLTAGGYHRYEISNWAREGCESLHNKGYWERREYLGLGLGASSQMGNLRWKKTEDLGDYLRGDFERKEVQLLSREDQMEETMFLGLREMRGVSRRTFRDRFGIPMDSVYGEVLTKYQGMGLLKDKGGRVSLTDRGIDVSNIVLAAFLL